MGLFKGYATAIQMGHGSKSLRAEAARAEAGLEEHMMSLVTDLEWREWNMDKVVRGWGDCTACPLSRNRGRVVLGQGSLDPLLLVIGEAPGEQEDRRTRAFSGPSGALLRKVCYAMDLDLEDDAFLTNTVACFPGDVVVAKDERAQCRHRLEAQCSTLQPYVVLLLGRTAMKLLVNIHRSDTLGEHRGLIPKENWPWLGKRGTWHLKAVFLTYHPSYILHQQTKQKKRIALNRFTADIRKVTLVVDKLKKRVSRLT